MRRHSRDNLPNMPLPRYTEHNYTIDPSFQPDQGYKIHGTVNSDWGDDTNHQRSVTGIVIK